MVVPKFSNIHQWDDIQIVQFENGQCGMLWFIFNENRCKLYLNDELPDIEIMRIADLTEKRY